MSDQVFSVHPDNPRCFLYQGKPFKILTSAEHYGAVLNADFDYDVYLREMQRTGQNATRVFTFYREASRSIPGPGCMNALAPTPTASVMPWQRVVGRGKAADGLDKFDLDKWNPAYFARFKDYVGKCAQHGVICEIVLFCHPYSRDKYDFFPCSNASNINDVGAGIADPWDFLALKDPTIVAFQERFVRKMVEELNDFDNLYYEICNEPSIPGDSPETSEKTVVEWQSHLARVLSEAEARLPKRHLIAVNARQTVKVPAEPGEPDLRHDDEHYFRNPDIDIVNYHYISAKAQATGLRFRRLRSDLAEAGLIWHFTRQRDEFHKPIVFDETFSGVVGKAGAPSSPERYAVNRAEAWETILSGCAGYSNLDWSFTAADETGTGKAPIGDGRTLDGRCLREWLCLFRDLLGHYDLAALVPAVGVLPETIPGYGCAASTDDKGRYILYFVDEGLYRFEPCPRRALTVSLSLPASTYSARAFDPKTGATTDLPGFASEGPCTLEVPEFAEDGAVLLDPRSKSCHAKRLNRHDDLDKNATDVV